MNSKILIIGSSGYLGSRLLLELQKESYEIVGCDTVPSLITGSGKFIKDFYQNLTEDFLSRFNLIVWVAGHSSVKQSLEDPEGCLHNNCLDLHRLLSICARLNLPVIYASSASILSSSTSHYLPFATEYSNNAYDASKLAIDVLAQHLPLNCVSLRLGTLSGYSPKMRWDVIFNSMNRSGREEGYIHASNLTTYRSICFIDDLVEFIKKLIPQLLLGKRIGLQKINCSSWSGMIGTLAAEIAYFWNVPIRFDPPGTTYSFIQNIQEFQETFENVDFFRSIQDRCRIFANQMGWMAENE